jgi:hypothetical protein
MWKLLFWACFRFLGVDRVWSVWFVFPNPLLLQNAVCCHHCLWIFGRSSSNILHVAFLPPDGTCMPLALSSFRFLSSLHFTFGACYWPWPWVETEIHKTGLFKCHSTLRFLRLRLVIEAELCPTYSVELENAWRYISTALIYHKVLRIFDFTLSHMTLTVNRWMDCLFVYLFVVYLTTYLRI